jgi:curved DNA-binding protein CbpA
VPVGTRDLALVRTRYRTLVREHHPDVGGDHETMLSINEAYRCALAEIG